MPLLQTNLSLDLFCNKTGVVHGHGLWRQTQGPHILSWPLLAGWPWADSYLLSIPTPYLVISHWESRGNANSLIDWFQEFKCVWSTESAMRVRPPRYTWRPCIAGAVLSAIVGVLQCLPAWLPGHKTLFNLGAAFLVSWWKQFLWLRGLSDSYYLVQRVAFRVFAMCLA